MSVKIFKRQTLEDMGIDKETVDKIMDLHLEVVNGLKDERDEYKTKAASVSDLEKKNADLSKQLTAIESERNSLKMEHDKLKADVAGKETFAKKEALIAAELKNRKYSAEATGLILKKGGYVDKLELDGSGKATNLDAVFGEIQSDFAMFTPNEIKRSAGVDTPLANTGGSTFERMSLLEKMKFANQNPSDPAVLEWLHK